MGLKDMANCSERLDTIKMIMEKIVKLLIEQKRGKRKLENWGGGGRGEEINLNLYYGERGIDIKK